MIDYLRLLSVMGFKSQSFNQLLLHYLKFSLRLGKLAIRQIYVVVYKLHMKTIKFSKWTHFVSPFYFKRGRISKPLYKNLLVCLFEPSKTSNKVLCEVLIRNWFLNIFFTRRYIFNFLSGNFSRIALM